MTPSRYEPEQTVTPRTTGEVLTSMASYHSRRRDNYRQLAGEAPDGPVRLLFGRLVELEDFAITIIGDEHAHLQPARGGYLPMGPTTTINQDSASGHCHPHTTIGDAVSCALSSDDGLDELVDLLESSSAAASVQELASRLRELERSRDRQIASFVRED